MNAVIVSSSSSIDTTVDFTTEQYFKSMSYQQEMVSELNDSFPNQIVLAGILEYINILRIKHLKIPASPYCTTYSCRYHAPQPGLLYAGEHLDPLPLRLRLELVPALRVVSYIERMVT